MSYYVYFVATLPGLTYGRKAPFATAAFLERAAEMLPEADVAALAALADDALPCAHPWVEEWRGFRRALGNALVLARADKLGTDPAPHLRGADPRDVSFKATAGELVRLADPEEAERGLDRVLWQALDERASLHHFDFAVVATYFVKLLLLERWERLDEALGRQRLLTAVAGSVTRSTDIQATDIQAAPE